MEENSSESPSLSQRFRESYLAEARAQQRHSETSRSDPSSSRLLVYGSLKGKAEDPVCRNDPQFPDLSAFLSQEELDKSVNLARQAIGHESHDERAGVTAPQEALATPALLPSTICSSSVAFSAPTSVPFVNPSPAAFAAPSTSSFTQQAPDFSGLPVTHPSLSGGGKMHKSSSPQDGVIRHSRESGDSYNDLNRPTRNAPYGLETQSKKEFLNKAADFIEELSSLFKANTSKRVRPRVCKAHRSRIQNKSHNDGTVHPLSPDNNERTAVPLEVEEERPIPAVSHQPETLWDSGIGHVEFQDCRINEEQQCDSVSLETKEPESSALKETLLPAESVCGPPHFIQKLKSREVPEGSKVQLDCTVKGFPVPEVRWFCEGKELENSPDIQIITKDELHTLIITEAFEEDTGRYSCFASNCYGTDSTSAEIYIEGASSSDSDGEQCLERVAQLQWKPTKPAPSCPPSSSCTLSAELEDSVPPQPTAATEEPTPDLSSPPPNQEVPEPPLLVQASVTIHPEQELSPAAVVATAHQSQETTASLIQGFPTLPAGDLKEASEALKAISCAPLNQQNSSAPQPESQTTSYNHQEEVKGQPIMAAPVFTKSLQDLTVSEGQLVVLECRVKGLPSPKVDWYLEGKLIEDSVEFRILQKKEICNLVIAEVFPEDSGVYTCTARNNYGAVSTFAALRVKGNGNISNHMRPSTSSVVEPSQVQEPSSSDLTGLAVRPQPEVTATSSIKAHSSTIRLDPLISNTVRLDPLNTSTLRLDPHSSSMLRQEPLHTTLPSLDPSSLSSISSKNSHNTSATSLNLSSLYLLGTSGPRIGPQSSGPVLSNPKPFSASSVVETSAEQEACRPWQAVSEAETVTRPDVKETSKHQTETPTVVPLPDPPANSCLKTGALVNHKDSRSSARVGLHVHFKLPEDEEDEQSDASSQSSEDTTQASVLKEPPPVLAKPKLDPAQLQLLHNQVLMEQQQEGEPQPQTRAQVQIQSEVQRSQEAPLWSPRMHHAAPNTMMPPQQTPAPPLTSAPAAPSLRSAAAPTISSTFSPAPAFGSIPSTPHLKTSSVVTSPPPVPQLNTAPASTLHATPVTQKNTIHASHLNISPAGLARTAPYDAPPAPPMSTPCTESMPASQHMTSPAALLRSTHASLMNLVTTSHTFNYARPKEFIAAQTFSPIRSPSPTESPVPLLQELAAELNSSAASSPTLPPFSPPPRIFPTRVLMSPTSPPALVTSPTPGSGQFLNTAFAVRAQSPPHASSPTSSSSTPSPIQNPVAFLSSVLPSLTLSQPTNSMGLPKGAPTGLHKKMPKARLSSSEDIRYAKETLLQEIDSKLRFRDDVTHFPHQQKQNNEGKTASRPLGPNIPATVINYDEEYKVSSFEQRLMSEIEFRLERTPVEESDEEVQHDDIPTGKCIAPIFDKKLKNFKAVEGVPVTFSCKVLGIPIPKVYWFKDGKQILRKNVHYKKIREGDGVCMLHIEFTTSDDDGNYTIMAANPQGRASCSGHLIVQTGPPHHRLTPIHSQRVRTRVQEVEGDQSQEHFFKPHFLQAPGDMLAHEGRLCRVDCKVSGLPNPELMWLLNGRPIYSDPYHKMLIRENGIHSLVIDPVTKRDGGTYTCIASNKAGQSSFCLELKVVEREMKHPPQFMEKLQNMGIPEGSPVRLECRVVGLPSPVIFWKKDNDTIPKTKDRFSMYQDSTGYVCLLIQPTTKDDAGWYTVSAKNEAGVVSCTCRLDLYAQWHQSIPVSMKKVSSGSRYAALTGQGLDIKSAFPTSETSPILFSSSPPEVTLESEEL